MSCLEILRSIRSSCSSDNSFSLFQHIFVRHARALSVLRSSQAVFNVSGQKTYPKWTNHFDPGSVLFTPAQRMKVHLSTAGLLAVGILVCHASTVYGASTVLKLYGIPWLCVSHWFIMITYLHHTDPNLPHYRGQDWTFARGAASTMDRPVLGWQGRFFLHDVAHFHVVHHFFPSELRFCLLRLRDC
jgi:fatty acid desaturase